MPDANRTGADRLRSLPATRYEPACDAPDRDGTLVVADAEGGARAYAVTEYPADRAGRAFRLAAADGTAQEVFLGDGRPDDCDCAGFAEGGWCDHAGGLRAAVAGGSLTFHNRKSFTFAEKYISDPGLIDLRN